MLAPSLNMRVSWWPQKSNLKSSLPHTDANPYFSPHRLQVKMSNNDSARVTGRHKGLLMIRNIAIKVKANHKTSSNKKRRKKSILSLCYRVKHTNQNDTHAARQRDNWGIVGSRHVTRCVFVCVSQKLFLDEHINRRLCLPRHRHAARSSWWQSYHSHLFFLTVCSHSQLLCCMCA